jgi:hypothetical protein
MIQISSCLQLEKCVGKLPQRERVCVCREGFIASTVEKTRVGVHIRSFPVFNPTDRARTSSYRVAKKRTIALAQKLCFAKKQKTLIDCLKEKRSRRRRGICLRLPADHFCDRGEGVASEIDFLLSLSSFILIIRS